MNYAGEPTDAWPCSSPGAWVYIPLVKLHEFPVGLSLQPLKFLLNGGITHWCNKLSSVFYISCKFVEGEFCLIIQVIN